MNYLPKLLTTGAIRETPKRIIERIADEVHFTESMTIVEVGAGLGEITAAVLQRNTAGEKLTYYAFEIDAEACARLHERFPQISVVSESAFEFEQHIPPHVGIDYFISSIPLSFYKREQIEEFLQKIRSRLNPGGKLIILFSAAWLLPLLKKNLPGVECEPYLTFPPYFTAVYQENSKMPTTPA